VVEKIVASLDSIPGRKFYSPTHRLIRDRENLIIQPIAAKGELTVSPESYPINRGTKHFKQEIELSFFETQDIDSLNLNLPLSASLDAGKLQFPLRLRRWQQGDFFVPLGVGGKKKLSDFLIDNKLSLAEKEEVWVLLSGDEIVWVVGWRIDHRYRITAATREALQVLLIR
jgi:tRNA(Ile)-lysidine synthase